ncbi:MAG: M20/M25/M40 family metallo-hydrolase [Oscillibacter sp.]|nr:M20/M25/M40 family metallo-hydrolase [Oscillibacter sp.]
MYLDCFEEVKQLTKELVSIPSIVREPHGETNCAKHIHEYYMGLDYFKRHPNQTKILQTEDDFVERHSAYAYVKGTKGTSNRTVILIGHIDTVGVDDYGIYREYAFDPDNLPEKLLELTASEEVRADIASGEYLFGRGALDMKSGVAGHMYLIKYFAEHPEELDGNLIAYAECDEEDNSHGILTGLKEFKRLKETEGFEYIACINADYSTGYNLADINRYVYFGSIGKLLPSFYVTGKETHVGQAYGGLDPNLILSELTRLIELNTDLCDEAQGEVTVPPISLKQADFKEGYTVQTALAAYAYYNFFTHSMSPVDVMALSRQKAVEAFDNVIRYANESYQRYCEKSHVAYEPLPWKTRVYTWEEYCAYLEACRGPAFREHIFQYAKQLNEDEPTMDLRLFSIRVIEEAARWDEDKAPMVVVFFGSIFSARIEMTGRTEKEKKLLSAVEQAIEAVQPKCGNPIKVRMFYPYISDSSFMAISDDVSAIEAMGRNMPSWKTKYFYDVDLVMGINVPVVNIGSFGKDGHKVTERVHMKYTFENVPNMTYRTICDCLS